MKNITTDYEIAFNKLRRGMLGSVATFRKEQKEKEELLKWLKVAENMLIQAMGKIVFTPEARKNMQKIHNIIARVSGETYEKD